jgi:hypothetical protein
MRQPAYNWPETRAAWSRLSRAYRSLRLQKAIDRVLDLLDPTDPATLDLLVALRRFEEEARP